MKTWILDEAMDAANVAAMRDVITATLAVHAVKPVAPVMDDDDELARLRADNARLREALARLRTALESIANDQPNGDKFALVAIANDCLSAIKFGGGK